MNPYEGFPLWAELLVSGLVLLGLQHASAFYFEAAMLIALFGFVGSTAMAKFLLRGEVIE